MNIPISSFIVELHVPDFSSAKHFYARLGFAVVWEIDTYVVLERRRTVLLIYGGSEVIYEQSYFGRMPKETARGYGVELILMVDDPERLYEELRDPVEIAGELRTKEQNGMREFRILDPFGYYIRITEAYNWFERSGPRPT